MPTQGIFKNYSRTKNEHFEGALNQNSHKGGLKYRKRDISPGTSRVFLYDFLLDISLNYFLRCLLL